MAQSRRVRIRFRIGGRRWEFPRRRPQFGRRNPIGPGLQTVAAATPSAVHTSPLAPVRLARWPILASAGSLDVRIAESDQEIDAAQRLRYRVFYEEMSALPTPQMRELRRDFD